MLILYFLRPLLRLSIAFLWLWSGIVSLFFFPHEQSYQFLAGIRGITGSAAPITLYGLALMDITSRFGYLVRVPNTPVDDYLQLTLIFLYTLTITFSLCLNSGYIHLARF